MEHRALLRAVESSEFKVFYDWYENTRSQNNCDVKEAIDRLSQKDLVGIWTVFSKWIRESIEMIKNNQDSDLDSAFTTLTVMSVVASYSLDNFSSSEPQHLRTAIISMNGVLNQIKCKKTGTCICELSENFWKIHSELEASLVPNVLEWLINAALESKSSATLIKHLWSLKDAIRNLNPDLVVNSALQQSFLVCASNPKFTSNPDGRKFVACLFGLDPTMVQLLHQAIKKHLPYVTTAESELYGEIYFRAWRHSPEKCRAEVESIIQDLMYCAVVASRKPLGTLENGSNKVAMNRLLFHLLHALHRHKKQRTVAVMIYNLYKPILWRYLEATNGFVRANALCLLFDAFPLESGEGIEEDEVLRNKQWSIILTSLMDPDALVRSIAVQGTCQILTEYWELIPINIIQEFIACMLRKLLYDSASPLVRTSVVKGMIMMLDNKQTHPLLEKMVPLTSKVLHDVNEKVRAEYVSLLTRIQSLRVSKLWEVIDMNHLVVRLAIDTSKNVCRRLVVLLAPFYNPKSQPEVVLERCLRLIMDNRTASRKFYECIHFCTDIQQIAQLILVIWKFLRNFALKQLQLNRVSAQREEGNSRRPKRSRRIDPAEEQSNPDEDKENQDLSSGSDNETADIGETDSQDDIGESTILGLIDAVCILLTNNKAKMKTPQNLVYWKNILQRFTKSCSLFFRYFRQNSTALRSIIYMYGLLSSNSSPIMLSFVKSQLKSLDDEATRPEFSHLLDALCNWGRGDDILEFIAENIQRSLASLQPPKPQKSKGRKKSVQFDTGSDAKPHLALRCMLYVLQNAHNKKLMFRQNLSQVEDVCRSLEAVMGLIDRQLELPESDNKFALEAASLYVKLTSVLISSYKRDESQSGLEKYAQFQGKIKEILQWIQRLMDKEIPAEYFQDFVSSAVTTISNLLMVHTVGPEICHQYVSILSSIMERCPSSKILCLLLSSTYHCLEYIRTERSIGNDDAHLIRCEATSSLVIAKILEHCSRGQISFTAPEHASMKETVQEILIYCQRNHGQEKSSSSSQILQSVVAVLEREMEECIQNPECQFSSVKELPSTTQIITLAFRSRNALGRIVLHDFIPELGLQNESIGVSFHGFFRFINTLVKDQGKISNSTLVEVVTEAEHRWNELKKNPSTDKECDVTIHSLLKEIKLALKMEN